VAKAGFVGLTWTDSKGNKQSTKYNWHKDAKRILGPAIAVALQKAGLEVRRNTQRGMVGGSTRSGRSLRASPVWWQVGEKNGYPVVAFVRKVPRPDKVSSWAPQAFLRNDVVSDYDGKTQSVVIGPSKVPWLNQLHELGGQVGVWVQHTRYPVKEYGGRQVPRKFQRQSTTSGRGRKRKLLSGAYVGIFDNTRGNFYVGTRTVQPRRYMQNGLQASLHKIPQQFHRTIRGVGS
jgi:hypothetical protein